MATHIVGRASRKLNSVAALRCSPKSSPPTMLAPLREVPGTMARAWKTPMRKACLRVMVSRLCVVWARFERVFSMMMNAKPPKSA